MSRLKTARLLADSSTTQRIAGSGLDAVPVLRRPPRRTGRRDPRVPGARASLRRRPVGLTRGPVPRSGRRAAHLQAGRGRPDRGRDDRAPRQGAGGGQGRAQDQVEVRGPARAHEPRGAPALRGSRARHRDPGGIGRPLPCDPRGPGPPRPRGHRAGGRRPAQPRARAQPGAVQDARRRAPDAGHERQPAGGRRLPLESTANRGRASPTSPRHVARMPICPLVA